MDQILGSRSLDYDPDSKAALPEQWIEFLQTLFEDDMESWDLLQDWFGYCLTGDTSQQKMLLLVGPKRSGCRCGLLPEVRT